MKNIEKQRKLDYEYYLELKFIFQELHKQGVTDDAGC